MIGERNLPNFKIKKHTKTPAYLRSVCCEKGINELFSKLGKLNTAPITRVQTPQKLKFAEGAKKKRFTFSLIEKEKHCGRVIKSEDSSPVIRYKNVEMPADLMVMDKFRKEIITEIKKKRSEISLGNLEEVKTNYFQQNLSQFQPNSQKSKEKKDLVSRNSFNNAIYSIRALPNSSKSKIYKKLKKRIPYGTRFHIKK